MLRESSCRVKHRPPHLPKELNKPTARERSDSWSLERLLRRLRAMEANQDDKLARVLRALGEFGAFQRRLVVLILIPNILLAFLTFADFFVFTAQRPYCNTSWILAVGPNLTEAEQMNLTLPRGPDGSFQTCLMYLPVAWDLDSIIRFGLNYTKSCQDGWIYPDTKKRSLINEVWLVLSCLQLPHRPRDVPLTEQFDLVCGKEQNSESVQTILTAGLLIGSLLFGLISDKLGRCPTLLVSLLGLMVFGFGTAFVNTFNQYLFFRFGVSQALVGYTISSVSLATEWLLTEHRAHAVILEHCFFSVGVLLLTGLAYSLPHWRLLFLLGGAPAFPLISYIWPPTPTLPLGASASKSGLGARRALPESPRWLLMKGRLEDAKRALCHAADVNKTTLPLSLLDKVCCRLQLFHRVPEAEGLWHERPPQIRDPWHRGGARPAVLRLPPRARREEVEPVGDSLPRLPYVLARPHAPLRAEVHNGPGDRSRGVQPGGLGQRVLHLHRRAAAHGPQKAPQTPS
ncbi:solute carrier family 22 member 14 isoform X9 [Hyaena hyaena]|uniref:solute carrier family 22 member 14 isoform X9 n=1 Tax=Hyaena hyaena TaxID=95912 RepID=UPI001921E51A|nr:solute carrier family 22 member 14 isoform X9 [Hyaena hyaena]